MLYLLLPYHFSASDDSSRSQALSMSLATVMKEWGVHRGVDRQPSFAMKDINKTSFKSVIGGKFKSKQKVCLIARLCILILFVSRYFCSHIN